MDRSHLSKGAHDRLRTELERRSGAARREISERLERARELGDITENADYDAAKNEQGLNEARIRQLEALLRTAVIVEAGESDAASPGTIVTVRIEGDDAPQEYLLGSIEERHDTHDVLSTSSPMGQALLGKAPGERTTYRTPRGRELGVEVLDVRPAE